MDQPYEFVQAVKDPSSFIRAQVESKPSGLRHLLREMQNRKRVTGAPRDKNLLNKASPSAFERAIRRKNGLDDNSLETKTRNDKASQQAIRLND